MSPFAALRAALESGDPRLQAGGCLVVLLLLAVGAGSALLLAQIAREALVEWLARRHRGGLLSGPYSCRACGAPWSPRGRGCPCGRLAPWGGRPLAVCERRTVWRRS